MENDDNLVMNDKFSQEDSDSSDDSSESDESALVLNNDDSESKERVFDKNDSSEESKESSFFNEEALNPQIPEFVNNSNKKLLNVNEEVENQDHAKENEKINKIQYETNYFSSENKDYDSENIKSPEFRPQENEFEANKSNDIIQKLNLEKNPLENPEENKNEVENRKVFESDDSELSVSVAEYVEPTENDPKPDSGLSETHKSEQLKYIKEPITNSLINLARKESISKQPRRDNKSDASCRKCLVF